MDHGANPNSAGEISIKQEIEQDGVLQKDVLVLRNITPLMLSVIMADNAEVVKELLRHRASRNSRDSITHRTALEWAEYVDSTKDTNPDKDRTKVISVLKASKSVRHSRR